MDQDIADNFKLTWLPKKTFEILVTISWTEIKKVKDLVVEEASQEIEIKGFRKGKAPKKLVLENLNQQKVLESILSKIVPEYYQKAITHFGLNPIINPKLELVSNKDNENWQIKFLSCELPDVNLGNYKEELRKEKAVSKIWKPGEKAEEKKPNEAEERENKLQRSIEFLLKNITVEPSDLLVEDEVNHKLASLLDQTQKLGITIDQYLASVGKTIEQLKKEYQENAKKNLSLEFIIHKIAEVEKIVIKPEEIEKAISSAKTEEEKKSLESQKYLLASLLRQQKTLDFLANLL